MRRKTTKGKQASLNERKAKASLNERKASKPQQPWQSKPQQPGASTANLATGQTGGGSEVTHVGLGGYTLRLRLRFRVRGWVLGFTNMRDQDRR